MAGMKCSGLAYSFNSVAIPFVLSYEYRFMILYYWHLLY